MKEELFPEFAKSLKDLEVTFKEEKFAWRELNQRLLKMCSDTAEARMKLLEATNSLLAITKLYTMPEEIHENSEIDEMELAHQDKEAELADELRKESQEENDITDDRN